jgi:hypothetical protein
LHVGLSLSGTAALEAGVGRTPGKPIIRVRAPFVC